jgi:hypothetical protein
MTRQTPRRYGQGSPVGNQIRDNISKQDLGSIMRPDPEMGTKDAGKSLAALRNGDYQGLEGIQFGVMQGNPVAILPDGHAVVISAGEAMQGITQRNKRRQQIGEQMAYDEDVKHFAETNRATMKQLVDGFEFAPSIAGAYMSFYEQAPMETMQDLLQFDRDQRDQATRNLVTKQRTARNNTISRSLSMMAKNAKGSTMSAEDAGRLQVGISHLGNFATRAAPLDDLNMALTDPAALSELQMAVQGISPGTLAQAKRAMIDNQRDAEFVGEPYQMNAAQDYPKLHGALQSMLQQAGMASAVNVDAAVAAVLGAETMAIDPSSVRAHGRVTTATRLKAYRSPNPTADLKAFRQDDTQVPDYITINDDGEYVMGGKELSKAEVSAVIRERDAVVRIGELAEQHAGFNQEAMMDTGFANLKKGTDQERLLADMAYYYYQIINGDSEAVESMRRMEMAASDIRKILKATLEKNGIDVDQVARPGANL